MMQETKDHTKILEAAKWEHGQEYRRRIVQVVALYSGGYDSAVTAHVSQRWAAKHKLPFVVLSIDTLLSADGWREYVANYAAEQGWPHLIKDAPDPHWFFDWAEREGFPYSPTTHEIVYQRLKERAILEYLQEVKAPYQRPKQPNRPAPANWVRVLFCSGIRKYESSKREALENPIQRPRSGSAVFVNPLFWWREEDKIQYMIENDLPINNPFYDTVGGSGDCSCNWGQFVTLEKFAQHSPRRAAEIRPYHEHCRAVHGYGWGERPNAGAKEMDEEMGEISSTGMPILCYGCRREKPHHSAAMNDVALARMSWE